MLIFYKWSIGKPETPRPQIKQEKRKKAKNFFEKILIYANIEDFLKPKLLF